MLRREFIAGLGSAAVWPRAVRAQQPAMPVIGVLITGTADDTKNYVVSFFQGTSANGAKSPQCANPNGILILDDRGHSDNAALVHCVSPYCSNNQCG